MEVCDRLRAARQGAGFSSGMLAAKHLGVPYGTYSSHENGSRGIRSDEMEIYSQAFGVEYAWLAIGKGSPGRPLPPLTSLRPSEQPQWTTHDGKPLFNDAQMIQIIRSFINGRDNIEDESGKSNFTRAFLAGASTALEAAGRLEDARRSKVLGELIAEGRESDLRELL